MFQGFTALGGSAPIWIITSSDGVTPAAPDEAPSVSVYEEGSSTAVQSGLTMTGTVDSKTGFYRLSITATSGNGYASGKTYACHVSWEVSSAAKSAIITFCVT